MGEIPGGEPIDLAFLERTPIFGAIERTALVLLAEHLQRRVLAAGSRVVAEGEGAREMYVVERGEVEVLVHVGSSGEEDLVLARLGAGDCFGEMSLLDVQPRSATVRTVGETSLLVLRYRDLLAVRKRDPEAFVLLVLNVGREVSRRLRVCHAHLVDVLRASPERQHLAQEVFGSPSRR